MTGFYSKPYLKYIPAIVGALLYCMTFNHGFVLDDHLVITQNIHVSDGISGIPTILSTNYANGHQGKNFNDGLYRPLSLVTFAMEESLFSLNPGISHLIQALLYGLLLLGLFLWMHALFPERGMLVFWIVMLFAVHPIHTEVVANLKGRDDLLAMLFFSFSAWHFIRWVNNDKRKNILFSILLFSAALFCKESSVTYLAVFPLMLWFIEGKSSRQKWTKTGFMILPVILFLGTRALVLSQMGEIDSGVTGILQNVITTTDSITERIATAASIQGLYFTKLCLPFNLSHDYSYNALPLRGLKDPIALLWLIVTIALIWIGIAGMVKRKAWAFGILFYFITISVVANLFILIGALAAERFVFAPSLGWSIAVVFAVDQFKPIAKQKQLLFGIVAVIFLGLSMQRIPDWKDNYTLFTTDVGRVPNSARAHYNAGTAENDLAKTTPQQASKLRASAAQHLRRAIEIWPDYQDAYNNLGVVYIDAGQPEEAYKVYKTLIQQFPGYTKGAFNLAYACYEMKRYQEAERYYELYYSSNSNLDVLYMIAECEGYQNKFGEAMAHLETLIQQEPNKGRGYLKLGMAKAMTGAPGEAENLLKKGLQVEPRNADLHLNLALVYMNTNRPDLARESLRDALSFNPNLERAKQILNQLQ